MTVDVSRETARQVLALRLPDGNDAGAATIRAGLIDGVLDEDGYIETLDEKAADRMILAAIDELAATP